MPKPLSSRLFPHLTFLATLFLVSAVFFPLNGQDKNDGGDFKTLAAAAGTARDQNNVEEAIRNYREALKLRPDWQEGWWYVGTLEYQRDHYVDAIPSFRRLTQLAPEAGPAWNFLGLCEYETKDYAKAREHLSKGQSLGGVDDPEILRVAQYHLALLFNREGKFDAAIAALEPLLSNTQAGSQIKTALGLATLRVPLLPEQVDPSQDALLQEAGTAAALVAQRQMESALQGYAALSQKYPDVPYVHFAYGVVLFAAGKSEQALAELRTELKISPRSAVVHELLAKSLDARGKHDQAQMELAAAQKLRAANGEVEERIVQRYMNRSELKQGGVSAVDGSSGIGSSDFEQLAQEAAEANAAGDTQLAMRRYREALSVRPDWQDGLWNLAMLSYAARKYPEAVSALKSWLEREPNSGTAWAVMGLAEFELKDYDNALIHLQRGQRLGLSGNLESVQLARYRLASLLLRSGQFENAEAVLMPVAGQGSLAGEVRLALGMSMLRTRALPAEVESSKKALVAATGEIAELLKDSKYDAAFPKFEALIKQYPGAQFLHYVYGTALATFSRYDEAEEQFRKEISLTPESELPYLQLAAIALKRHRANEALASGEQAVKLAAQSAEAHYLLGRAHLEMGNARQAIEELEAASKLAPESAQIHFNLAKAYAKANLQEKAAEQRAIFARLNALAEEQRSVQGSQSYGAHNATDAPFSPANEKEQPVSPRPN